AARQEDSEKSVKSALVGVAEWIFSGHRPAVASHVFGALLMGEALQGILGQINPYILQIIVNIGIGIVLALGLNVITGLTGQLSLGHAAFMSVGAFASALLTIKLG